MALDAAGLSDAGRTLLSWTRHLRDGDGAYWTGCVHPQCLRFPGGERSTYTGAAVILANHGTVTVGADLEEAFYRLEVLERAAHVQVLR